MPSKTSRKREVIAERKFCTGRVHIIRRLTHGLVYMHANHDLVRREYVQSSIATYRIADPGLRLVGVVYSLVSKLHTFRAPEDEGTRYEHGLSVDRTKLAKLF